MARTFILLSTLLVLAVLGFLTLKVAVLGGVTVLVVLAVVLMLMIGIGVVGALMNPPPDE